MGFYFWKLKRSLAPQIILSNHSFYFRTSPRQSCCLLFFLPSNQAYVELRVGIKWHVCFAYVIESKTKSKQKRVIQPDQKVQVCGIYIFFLWIVDEILCMIYLSPCIFMDMGYIHILFSSSLFFSFDMPCGHVAYLLWVCIFSLSFTPFFSNMPFGHVAYLLWVCIFYFFFV